MHRRLSRVLSLLALALLPFFMPAAAPVALAMPDEAQTIAGGMPAALEGELPETPSPSHRVIVELVSPPLAAWVDARGPEANQADGLTDEAGLLDVEQPLAQAYLSRLRAEQAAFEKQLSLSAPDVRVSTYMDEHLREKPHRYAITFNGLTVESDMHADLTALMDRLRRIPGVKAVYRDHAQLPQMYASLPLINAGAVWNHPDVGGQAYAGAGIRVASMDGGVHHQAPMFDGTDYEYPRGYPRGYLPNTNGKIIVSRAYFRSFDPPAAGDEKPWPGENGTPHGVHTASTAAGNSVVGDYWGTQINLSGVAPKAYVMSYRVFYASVQDDGSFHNAEGIACLEDVVKDRAQVLNNSWGGGPGSSGGKGDPLDTALINAVKAGVFVSMSAGNAGPNDGTGDHPSDDYITVAASSTSGTYASGRLNVSAPAPVPDDLTDLAIAIPDWGALMPVGATRFRYLSAQAADPNNFEGCEEWPPGTFAGRAAVISRGACEFGQKAFNAEKAGAVFVVIHNHANGGDAPMGMGGGQFGGQVTIPAISLGHSDGLAVVEWHRRFRNGAEIELNTSGFPVGNDPDVLAGFSSRGPGVGEVLKPDLAAPGVNIMAQGYDGSVRGEARHLGYGQVSGTSMAAPHVAGAAAMLRHIHPDWDNAAIKSALMSTSQFMDIHNGDGSPAQPLDMGAGRLDLSRAADPGVILDPPSLSFGRVVTGTQATIELTLTSVADDFEMYILSSVDTRGGFTQTKALAGLSVNARSVVLAPGESQTISVTWDSAASGGLGDQQGYLLLRGFTHEAHLPLWMRVVEPTSPAEVLLIDHDGSGMDPAIIDAVAPGFRLTDYRQYYTRALNRLGVRYDIHDADAAGHISGTAMTIPSAAELSRYKIVIIQTGDYAWSDGAGIFPGTTALNGADLDTLMEYLNGGGRLLAFGQDLAATFDSDDPDDSSFVYGVGMGATWQADSVTGGEVMSRTHQLVMGVPGSPLTGKLWDLSAVGDGAGNQSSVDEITTDSPVMAAVPVQGLEDLETPEFAEDGLVAGANRDSPSLERPNTTYAGRTLYFGFGLEGVNDDTGYGSRQDLLGAALGWLRDEAVLRIEPTMQMAQEVSTFNLTLLSSHGGEGVEYRMDFGDGSPIHPAREHAVHGHSFPRGGTYTVRAEAKNAFGTVALAEMEVYVPPRPGEPTPGTAIGNPNRPYGAYLPILHRGP